MLVCCVWFCVQCLWPDLTQWGGHIHTGQRFQNAVSTKTPLKRHFGSCWHLSSGCPEYFEGGNSHHQRLAKAPRASLIRYRLIQAIVTWTLAASFSSWYHSDKTGLQSNIALRSWHWQLPPEADTTWIKLTHKLICFVGWRTWGAASGVWDWWGRCTRGRGRGEGS